MGGGLGPKQSDCRISNLDQSEGWILYHVTWPRRNVNLRSGTEFGYWVLGPLGQTWERINWKWRHVNRKWRKKTPGSDVIKPEVTGNKRQTTWFAKTHFYSTFWGPWRSGWIWSDAGGVRKIFIVNAWRPESCETNVCESDLAGVVGIWEGFHSISCLSETNSVFDMSYTCTLWQGIIDRSVGRWLCAQTAQDPQVCTLWRKCREGVVLRGWWRWTNPCWPKTNTRSWDQWDKEDVAKNLSLVDDGSEQRHCFSHRQCRFWPVQWGWVLVIREVWPRRGCHLNRPTFHWPSVHSLLLSWSLPATRQCPHWKLVSRAFLKQRLCRNFLQHGTTWHRLMDWMSKSNWQMKNLFSKGCNSGPVPNKRRLCLVAMVQWERMGKVRSFK